MVSSTNKFKIYPEYNLVIELHSGTLNLTSYLNFKKKLFTHKEFKSGMNYFINLKKVNFDAPTKDIEKFADFNNQRPSFSERRKIALVTDTPSQVVSTTIYKSLLSNHNQDIEIFSTNEKALSWLITEPITQARYKEVLAEL
ncbi:hypothetical protein SAMN05444411_10441 [Lutibacter oricola]|uniref:SpoIIAA-like n=1 Tax=Lutibacter oricola TaxID=762486 RepID=A0A1H3A818_9FLAO|nr:hypothetical protein [Lutibacter oricola]SDX25314.1 hypothetical protein SAMN05444411_10441 [Lutibacter oricola]